MGLCGSKEAGENPAAQNVGGSVKFSKDTKEKLPDPNAAHRRDKSITGNLKIERTGSQTSLTDSDKTDRDRSNSGRIPKSGSMSKKGGPHTPQGTKNLNESLVSLNSLGTNVRDVYEGLDDDLVLGTGNWGVVKVVTRKRDNKKFACKIVKLDDSMSDHQKEELRTEINALRQLDHVSVAKLFETFEEPGQKLYLIMELLTGGELYSALVERSPTGRFDEIRTRKLARRMVSAIAYLHDRGLVHRDIKLENFCFRGDEEDDEIVLIDFGLAKLYDYAGKDKGEKMTEVVGSSYYIAPEIVEGSYSGPTPDVWSLGVIIFMMLCGRPPFDGTNDANIMRKTLKGRYDMEDEVWKTEISTLAQDFVKRCLTRDVNLRMTSKEALRHQWLTASEETLIDAGAGDDPARALAQLPKQISEELGRHSKRASRRISQSLFGSDVGEVCLDRIRHFAARHELVRVFSQAVAFSLGREELKELVKVFVKLDRNSDGYITASDLEVGLLGAPPEEADQYDPSPRAGNFLDSLKSSTNKEDHKKKFSFNLGQDDATRNRKRRRRETNYLFTAIDIQKRGKVSLNEFLAASLDSRAFFKDEKLLADAFARVHGMDNGVSGDIHFRTLESLLGVERYTEKRAKRLIGEFVAIGRYANGLVPPTTPSAPATPGGERPKSNRYSMSKKGNSTKNIHAGEDGEDYDAPLRNPPKRVDADKIMWNDFKNTMIEVSNS